MQITGNKFNRSWYLSGVSEMDGSMGWQWRRRIPSPGKDVRQERNFETFPDDHRRTLAYPPPDRVVAYKIRYVLN